jgi:hypothetical protein
VGWGSAVEESVDEGREVMERKVCEAAQRSMSRDIRSIHERSDFRHVERNADFAEVMYRFNEQVESWLQWVE